MFVNLHRIFFQWKCGESHASFHLPAERSKKALSLKMLPFLSLFSPFERFLLTDSVELKVHRIFEAVEIVHVILLLGCQFLVSS